MKETIKPRTVFFLLDHLGSLSATGWLSVSPMPPLPTPSRFKMLMDQCNWDIYLMECLLHQDDVANFLNALKYFSRPRDVFQHLDDAGLKLKCSKCEFSESCIRIYVTLSVLKVSKHTQRLYFSQIGQCTLV